MSRMTVSYLWQCVICTHIKRLYFVESWQKIQKTEWARKCLKGSQVQTQKKGQTFKNTGLLSTRIYYSLHIGKFKIKNNSCLNIRIVTLSKIKITYGIYEQYINTIYYIHTDSRAPLKSQSVWETNKWRFYFRGKYTPRRKYIFNKY